MFHALFNCCYFYSKKKKSTTKNNQKSSIFNALTGCQLITESVDKVRLYFHNTPMMDTSVKAILNNVAVVFVKIAISA